MHSVAPLGHSRSLAQQRRGVGQLGRDDHGRLGQLGDARAGHDRHAERAGVTFEHVDQPAPAADHVAGGERQRQQRADGPLPDERGRQRSRVVVERVDAGEAGQHRGGRLAGAVGGPRAEVAVDRRRATAQAQHGRDRRERRGALELALPAEAHAAQRRRGDRRDDAALDQPAVLGSVAVDRMRTEVGLVRAGRAARPPAEPRVRLQQAHARSALGARDRRDEPREPSTDNRDLRHLDLLSVVRSLPAYAATGTAYSSSRDRSERSS
jgi:hypothetical protein